MNVMRLTFRPALLIAILSALILPPLAHAQQATPSTAELKLPDITTKDNAKSTVQLVALLAVVSVVPAALLMLTSFTRIIIVLTLLRQALGAQHLPPTQVLAGLAFFM